MLVSRRIYLTDTMTDKIDWNNGNNVLCLLFSVPIFNLNHWRTHTERACVLCPSTLVWCNLQVTRGDHKDNVRVLHAKFSCSCVQTREFFKNTRVELQNTHV